MNTVSTLDSSDPKAFPGAALLEEGSFLEPFGIARGILLYGVDKPRVFGRAVRKLAEIRAGKVKLKPEKDFREHRAPRVLLFLAVLVLFLLALMGFGWWLRPGELPSGSGSLIVIACMPLIAFFNWRRLKATDPSGVLRRYVGFAASQLWSAAPQLVVSNDFDTEPRYVPRVSNQATGGEVQQFIEPLGPERYWNSLLNSNSVSRRRFVRFVRCVETRLGDDLVLVDCKCRIWCWNLLFLVPLLTVSVIAGVVLAIVLKPLSEIVIDASGLMAVPAMYFSVTSTSVQLSKLLVKIDGKWRLFNGELQGYEELDLSWLPKAGSTSQSNRD